MEERHPTLMERLEQEEAVEARHTRMLKLVVLIVSVIVFGIVVYGLSQPQKKPSCGAYTGQGSRSLNQWGSC